MQNIGYLPLLPLLLLLNDLHPTSFVSLFTYTARVGSRSVCSLQYTCSVPLVPIVDVYECMSDSIGAASLIVTIVMSVTGPVIGDRVNATGKVVYSTCNVLIALLKDEFVHTIVSVVVSMPEPDTGIKGGALYSV